MRSRNEIARSIAGVCTFENKYGVPEWDDWLLLKDGERFAETAEAMKVMIQSQVGPQNVPPWLTPANMRDGPYLCTAIQSFLKWPVTTPARSQRGVFLAPDPFPSASKADMIPKFVITDTVLCTGSHVKEACKVIATWMIALLLPYRSCAKEVELELEKMFLCVAVIFNDSRDQTLKIHIQEPEIDIEKEIPVRALVTLDDIEGRKALPISDRQALLGVRI